MRLRDILKGPGDWCKFAPCVDMNNMPCAPFSVNCRKVCLESAVQRQDALPVGQLRHKLVNAPTYQQWLAGNVGREFAPGRELSDFNDDNTWATIDRLIDEVTT